MALFVHTFRVRYHETDPQQFVFNSRYLEYADVSMTEYFRFLGWGYPELLSAGYDPSLVATHLTFHRPARLDDVIEARVTCVRVGTSSADLRFAFHREAELVCTVESTYVNVDVSTGRAQSIPHPIADALRTDIRTSERTSLS
ncbi:acyl-CoA thioesterase [Leifsonia sp. L25]|uniref:acyl-CoA thioesterase n=1 Tax=Actinomycetes TaxID=1760 RepID=UPI003D68C93E